MKPSDRIVLALDLPAEQDALDWVRRMSGRVGMFKIGLRLFTACGPALVGKVLAAGGSVFLDLKYHDIPNTVAAAVREAVGLGASLLTVHASGGEAMLRAASEAADAAARPGAEPARILAVTVLTSLGERDLAALGVARLLEEHVTALAEMAWMAGCAGVVASPREVRALRARMGPAPLIVTPAIRSPESPADDQTRTSTPGEAVAAGADLLVIGRPILEARDPDAALDAILAALG